MTSDLIASFEADSPVPLRIGTAGWSIPKQYASTLPADGSHLERYSRLLSCVEINSTFHRRHRPSTYARWAGSTPECFRFSVKAPKTITHRGQLVASPSAFQEFLDEISELAGKLGVILFQLPPRQSFDSVNARAFFEGFRRLHPHGHVAVEPRHLGWFSPEASELLEELQLTRVFADPPITAGVTDLHRPSKLTYYRLHGSPRVYYSSYSAEWLKGLSTSLIQHGRSSEVWCIFDNTASGAALGDALTLTRELTSVESITPS